MTGQPAFVPAVGIRSVQPRLGHSSWLCLRPIATACRSPTRVLPSHRVDVTCFESSRSSGRGFDSGGDEGGELGDEFDPDAEFEGYETVVLNDPATERSLPCVVENEVDVDGQKYLVCSPQEDVVAFAVEKDDELVCVEGEEKINALFETARAVMEEQHIKLKRSAYVMTADDADALILNGEDDDDDEDEDEDEEDVGDGEDFDDDDADEDDVEIIGEFCHEGNYFLVVRPEAAILIVARRTDDGLFVPEDDELERVTPAIEARLEMLEE